ncbi:MAG: hypothetical protein ACXVLQ_02685 [Bacteriovorax sp.]
MKQKFQYLFSLLLVSFFLQACSSGGREDRKELRTFFLTGSYDQGLSFIDKSKFYQDKDEKLLALMEKGMLLHAKGDWEESSRVLNEARTLSQELYTVSLSKKAEKTLLNDNYDVYYGEIYERSLLHFYLSLNAILNYQKTKKRDDLFRARAEVLAWDSFLSSIKEDRLGKSVYKNDLLLKIYGAKIHEMVDTREDKQIALQLYKDAKDVLFKNYNTYPTFNAHYQDFKKDYDKLSQLSFDEVKKKYVVETELYKNLSDYLTQNINRLSKKETKKLLKDNKTPVTLVLEKGIISEKVADKSFYSLDFLSKQPMVALFVADVLGLMPTPNSYNPGGAFLGIAVASTALKTIGVGFELPKIVNINPPGKQTLVVLDKNNKEVLRKEMALVNPMGDIAEEAVYESSAWTYSRVGLRLATKHATAIAASFATYKALGGGNRGDNNFLAKNAAVIQYIGAAKVIEESEKADTRYWSTLPNEVRLIDFDLVPGNYHLEIALNPSEKINLGDIEVTASDSPILFNVRKN